MGNQFLSGPQPQGTRGNNVSFIYIFDRDPTQYDVQNYYLLDFWLNSVTHALFYLASRQGTASSAGALATWIELAAGAGSVSELTANSGGPVGPAAGNINLVGDGVYITGAGNAGTHTITYSLINGATYTTSFLSGNDASVAVPVAQQITFTGTDGITISCAGSVVTVDGSGVGASSFETDNGTATPAAGVIEILANGGTDICGATVTTSGAGDVVQLHVSDAFDSTLIGLDAGTANVLWARNTGLGVEALGSLAGAATDNAALGYRAGFAYTTNESGNTTLGANVVGVVGESDTIRIGVQGVGGARFCYVAGITGVNVGSVASVVSIQTGGGNAGQLGTTTITAGANITVTPGANTITIAGTTPATVATSYVTDSGTAVPVANVLHIVANNGTNHSGSSVLFDAPGATNIVRLGVTDTNFNTLIGNNAGNATLTASNNTSLGFASAFALTSGGNNTLIGYASGTVLTTGAQNAAVGFQSLTSATTGVQNVALGHQALSTITTGDTNIGIGFAAGLNLTGAENNNILIGGFGVAGVSNLVQIKIPGGGNNFLLNYGTNNTFLGDASGNTTLTATNSTGIGRNALTALTSGNDSTAVGSNAAAALTSATNCTAVGYQALTTETTSGFNTAVGSLALTANHGLNNTAVGYNALGQIGTGAYQIALGQFAGFAYAGAESSNITIGNQGIAAESHVIRIGTYGAGNGQQNLSFIAGLLTTDNGVVATNGNIVANNGQVNSGTTMSCGTGLTVQAGGVNVVAGNVRVQNGDVIVDAGDITMPGTNVAGTQGVLTIGAERALFMPHNGNGNVAVGNAANLTLTGDDNTCMGDVAGESLTTGNANAIYGAHAGEAITTGSSNTILGFSAGLLLSTGSQNVLIGQVGSSPTTGSNNVLVGFDAGNNYTGGESSNLILVDPAVNGESNTIRIGTSGAGARQQNRCFIAGIRGITTGVADAVAVLVDSADQLGTISSSIKYKENIDDMGSYSDDIYKLRPVTFDFKNQPSRCKSVGLIAEEVEQVMPALAAYDKNGEIYSVKYQDLVPLLLNEVQKLKKELEMLKSQTH